MTSANIAPIVAGHSDRQVEPATLTVLTRVRELIVTGKMPAGSRLTAEAIARELGVSRTPVRSALAVLTAEGLASYSVNRGYAVRDITLRDVLDAVDARAVLEARGCGLSVDFGWSAEEFGRLSDMVSEGAKIVEADVWSADIEREWYGVNRAFHSMIVRVSRNNALRNAVRMTVIYPVFGDIARLCPAVARHVPSRYRKIPDRVPGHIVQSQADHSNILAAIASDDAMLAEKLMLAHVRGSQNRLTAITAAR